MSHSISSFLFQLTPPLILNIYRRLRGKTNSTFQGVYSNPNQIENFTEYDTKEALKTDHLEILEKIDKYNSGQTFPIANIRSQITNLFPLLISTMFKEEKQVILDYGGGMGASYLDCLNSIDTSGLVYYVQDLPETMDVGRNIFERKEWQKYNIHFTADFSELPHIDVIYLGSVLQYLPDYRSILSAFIKQQPKFLLIADNFMGAHKTYITAQVNMPGRRMPYRIFEMAEIINIFKENGYRLIYKSANYQPFHNFDDLPEEFRVSDSCNLLFTKGA